MAFSDEASLQLGNGQTEPVRHVQNHLPPIWGDRFSFSSEDSVLEAKAKEVEGLKQQVREMLMDVLHGKKFAEKIDLIYTLDRLGVSYHFENEINCELERMFMNLDHPYDDDQDHDIDLYTVSLQFLVFRHHGYKMSCDVFNKFKESSTGSFKESLASDIKGMLCLYEATHARVHGEDVLEEALAFTTTHLNCIATMPQHIISPLLRKQVTRALEQSFYKGIPRLEARFYISVYEEDESRNPLVLKFAKLDFNLVQLIHQRELSILSMWWKNLDFLSTFPYNKHCRMRLVEGYFFATILCFEPSYSLGRMMIARYVGLIVVFDDIYDSYGTVEELQLFTDSIDKWDLSCLNELPEYMKPLYKAVLETFQEFHNQVIKYGRSFSVFYSKQTCKELIKTYFEEAKWFHKDYIPPFDEYMNVAKTSSTCQTLVTTVFLGMDVVTKDALEWLHGRPRILDALETIGRLQDDIVGTELEAKASAVHSYMKQYGVSQKEAMNQLWEMVTKAWKDLNEEWLEPKKVVPWQLLLRIVNFGRFFDGSHRNGDGFDHPQHYAKYIHPILVDPVPLL